MKLMLLLQASAMSTHRCISLYLVHLVLGYTLLASVTGTPSSRARACVAEVWSTHGEGSDRLLRLDDVLPEDTPTKSNVIEVISDTRKQSVFGFGAALSNSAAYLIQSSQKRDEILQQLFSPDNGAGFSVVRYIMGGSDFQAVTPYTYNDINPEDTDYDMEFFSIEKDLQFMIPVMKSIKEINPQVKVVGTPWTAPAWMKLNKSLYGGEINSDPLILAAYAQYFVKFIQAFEAEGINIDALSIQNEPEHETSGYPTMLFPWAAESTFIRDHLGPAFRNAGITTEIWIFDHNWDMLWYPLNILDDAETREFVDATAVHCYGGNPDDIQEVHDAYPDKDIHFTECSGGEWSTDFAENLWWNYDNLFRSQLRHWSRSVMFWNLALDQDHGPLVNVSGCLDCRGVLTIDTTDDTFTLNEEFYNLAHFSQFVGPGAVCVDSSEPDFDSELRNVAFRDDSTGTTTVAVGNGWAGGWKEISIKIDDQYFNFEASVRNAELLTFVVRDC